jgi:methyl-accepting chemotaxis protein
MEQGTGPHEPPDPDSLPATKGDIRGLRRWLIVAGTWAVAASVIAIIALVSGDSSSGNSGRDASRDTSSQIARLQRALDKRIDDLQSNIRDLPTSDDVSKLESRLRDVEDKADSAATAAKDARSKTSDLETRVSDLEQAAQGDGGTTTPQTPP